MHKISVNNQKIKINVIAKLNNKSPSTYTVIFYDNRYKHTPDGQFISEYSMQVLIDSKSAINLNMDSCPDWFVSLENMQEIKNWFKTFA